MQALTRPPLASMLLMALAMTACASAADAPLTPSASPMPTPVRTASPSPTATASPSPSPSPTPSAAPRSSIDATYLALGDSQAVGAGSTRAGGGGYVHRLYADLRDAPPEAGRLAGVRVAELVNLAINGETSGSFISGGQLGRAVRAIRDSDPGVGLVTLDIGGNDLLRLLGTAECSAAPDGVECQRLVDATLAAFEDNYRRIMGELVAAAAATGREVQVVTLTYYNPFSGTGDPRELPGDPALVGVDGRVDCAAVAQPGAWGMNDLIACIGEEMGAVAVDIFDDFAGRGPELTHILSDDIHTNDAGHELIARRVAESLRGE